MTRRVGATAIRCLSASVLLAGLNGACSKEEHGPLLAQEIVAVAGGGTRAFWTYDFETDAWRALTDVPAAVGAGGALTQLQAPGFVYLLRGGGTADFYEYELNTAKWTQMPAAPGGVGAGGALAGANSGRGNQLYALQGGGSTALWKFDTGANVWTTVAQVPEAVSEGGSIAAPNFTGRVDVLAGGSSTTVHTVDLGSGSWTTLDAAPAPVGAGAGISFLFQGCDYALAGGGATAFFSTGFTCTGTNRLADTPAAVQAGGGVATAIGLVGVNQDRVFALRGGGTSDFWRYSITANAWTARAPTPGPVSGGGALVEVRPNPDPFPAGSSR